MPANRESKPSPSSPSTANSWGFRKEGRDLLAAVTGGAIVGMPLLYTMEMWSHGMTLGPGHQLGLLGAILLVNFLFSTVSGFRHEYGLASAALESVTAVGIGLCFSAAILWLVGEISLAQGLGEIIGKVLFEAAAVSLGVSLADAHVRGKNRAGEDEEESSGPKPAPSELERRQVRQDISDFTATLVGAVVFSINVGATEEVVLIAARLTPAGLLLLIFSSLLLCYVILFASGIKDQPVHVPSLVQSPVAETVLTYSASLVVALGLLWFLGERESVASAESLLGATVVLGLPTAVGGAAGRLVS